MTRPGSDFSLLASDRPAASDKPCPRLPGREQEVVDARDRRMAAQERGILVKRGEVFVAQLAECPKRHINSARRMSLRKHEEVGRLEDLMVQNQQQVEAGEIAPDVPDCRSRSACGGAGVRARRLNSFHERSESLAYPVRTADFRKCGPLPWLATCPERRDEVVGPISFKGLTPPANLHFFGR